MCYRRSDARTFWPLTQWNSVAAILATATEESQKVARNKGSTYRACYRRLAELPL
jgi:hypothetical protein